MDHDTLSIIVTSVLTVFAAPITVAVSGAGWKLWTLLDAKATAQQKATFDADVQTAMSVGINTAMPLIVSHGWHDAGTKAEVLQVATEYFKQRFPDQATRVVAAAGVNTDSLASPAATDAVSQTMEGRFLAALVANLSAPAAKAPLTGAAKGPVPTPGGVASGSSILPATTLAPTPQD